MNKYRLNRGNEGTDLTVNDNNRTAVIDIEGVVGAFYEHGVRQYLPPLVMSYDGGNATSNEIGGLYIPHGFITSPEPDHLQKKTPDGNITKHALSELDRLVEPDKLRKEVKDSFNYRIMYEPGKGITTICRVSEPGKTVLAGVCGYLNQRGWEQVSG